MSAALKYQTLDISKTFSKYNEICLCCVEELRASITLKRMSKASKRHRYQPASFAKTSYCSKFYLELPW